MVDNSVRADWAGAALQSFADESMDGVISDEAVMDLLCDLGHYAEKDLVCQKVRLLTSFELGLALGRLNQNIQSGTPMPTKRSISE